MTKTSQVRPPRIPVLDAKQATYWDEAARNAGSPSRVLMESAGRAAAHVMAQLFPTETSRGTLVVVGHGNNGGDGWVLARALHAVGAQVWVAEYDKERSGDCSANRDLALRDGVVVLGAEEEWPRVEIAVDALLGTGASGKPRGVLGDLAERVMRLHVPVTAVDGPTGLDLTTGAQNGPIRADLTVTFGGLRRGHLLARDWCGRVLVLDIGFGSFPAQANWPLFVDDEWANRSLPPFDASMHKGKRGRVAIIGGETGMAGAVQYSARAAFAAGSGLVRVAAHAGTTAAIQETFPDVTTTQTALGPVVEPEVLDLLEWADAVVLGPGLGRGDGRREFVQTVLEKVTCPIVLDADALQVGLELLKRGSAPRVLTPHAGEFAAAFPSVGPVEADRFDAASKAAGLLARNNTVLLKGVPTVIASGPDLRIVSAGNPGLATGGSGDILSGLIATFLTRGLTTLEAAALGAQALGRTAELIAQQTSVRTMRPNDVITMFPELWKTWRGEHATQPPVLLDLPTPQTD